MPIERSRNKGGDVGLLLTDRKHYSFEGYMADQVSRVFDRWQVPYQVIYLEDGTLMDDVMSQKRSLDWILGFEMTPYQKRFCDLMQIPYFYWMEESLALGWDILNSMLGKVGIGNLQIDQRLNHPRLFYLPHGVTRGTAAENKIFDLVLFADLLDLAFLKERWKELFAGDRVERIERAVACKNPLLAGHDYGYAEAYLKAEKIYRLLLNYQGEVKLDVFGQHSGNNWLLRLSSNIHLHSTLPYRQYFEVLRESKMALIDSSSPWYFPAIEARCLPVALKEAFAFVHTPDQREGELNRLNPHLLEITWECQVKKLMEIMK